MRTSGNDLEIKLVGAIKNPQATDMADLGNAVLDLLPKPSSFYAQTVQGFQFTVKNVAFRVTFARRRLVLQCRHMEGIRWWNGKFDNRKRNKMRELAIRVAKIVAQPPSPFD